MWQIHYKHQCCYLKENSDSSYPTDNRFFAFLVIGIDKENRDRQKMDSWEKEQDQERKKRTDPANLLVLSNGWLWAKRFHKSGRKWPKEYSVICHTRSNTHTRWTYTQVMYGLLLDVAQGKYVTQILGSVWFITSFQVCECESVQVCE